MNIIKQLAGMFFPKSSSDYKSGDPGLYYYIRCNKCGEVIRVRINPLAELSITDDGNRFVRKVVVGKRCYNQIEAKFSYNNSRKLLNSEISGGELVDEEEYDAQKKESSSESERTT